MKALKAAILALSLSGGLIIASSVSFGKAEYAKKEKKPCTACHVKTGSKELNDVGKCYQKNRHSLDDCGAKKAEEKK